MQNESKAGPLTLWMTRLQRKIDTLEREMMEGNVPWSKLARDLGTCDTYLKKLFVRARDNAFQTPEGPQIVQDLSHIKVRLERVHKKFAYTLRREQVEHVQQFIAPLAP
jgi:hypothetical protein